MMSHQEDNKKPVKRPRTDMPRQPASERVKNFSEVALGYTEQMAVQEAERCLNCKNKACIKGCPVFIEIPEFIKLVRERKFLEAAKKVREKNVLPAICGRVCPQEDQCEKECVLAKKGEPVAIGRLERFVADYEFAHGGAVPPKPAPPTGKKVAVIGSGPAGLTVAGDLARLGHSVTVFEALHKAGGVLTYGIPEFRLPKNIVEKEIEYVKKLGVKFELDSVIGRIKTIQELLEEGFDAVFIGTGAGLPYFMNIPGENLNGVYSANEFLTRSNLMKAYRFPEYDTPIKVGKRTAVVGGGNVAMDAARTAKRLGAEHVYNIYRRSRKEMPARIEEIENAIEEGIELVLLTNPVRILGDDKWNVKGIECIRMELGEPDESGRRKPMPIKGSEYVIDVETVVIAIGNGANPLIKQSTPGLTTNKWGNIIADVKTGLTSIEGVYAGGDIVTGAATVILAMGAGRASAQAIHEYLMKKDNK